METIRKALGIEAKPDYLETIPETLVNDDFGLHQILRHGFPNQPSCIAYDPVQQILAVGTRTGHILLLGKPGLEKHIYHPQPCIIQQLVFIINRGYLVSRCSTKSLYLWDLKQKLPTVRHELQFEAESPTTLCCPFTSEWMYVGTDKGNVHMLHVENFQLSGYCVYWNEIAGGTQPGDVISIEEHPGDQRKVLVAFAGGLCALWNVQEKKCEKKYYFDPGQNDILTSVSLSGNGKTFGCSYSDARIAIWNCKNDSKPEKVYKVHENVKASIAHKPIYKLQLIYTESNYWVVFMGGYPEESKDSPTTLTINVAGKRSTVLTTNSAIIDFLCLPSSPHAAETQKPFLLVVLTETELLARDLTVAGYPSFTLPFSIDLHLPSVTCVEYCAGAPDDLVASLLSARSKVPSRGNTKTWPLHGGRWGEETPDLPTDLIITGHENGIINLWQCNSVGFQRFFTIDTKEYFVFQDASPQTNPTPSSAPATPIQTPDKTLGTAPNNVPRSLSMPAGSSDVSLPANPSAPVFYVPLSPTTTQRVRLTAISPPATAPAPGPVQGETQSEGGEESSSIPDGLPEDEVDGHKAKKTRHRHKKGGDTDKKGARKKGQKAITEEQSPEKEAGEPVINSLGTELEEVETLVVERKDDMFSISEIQACMFGWWLCVANVKGSVMAFNFDLTAPEEALKPHSLLINFDENTLSKLNKASKSETETSPSASSYNKKYDFKTCLENHPMPGFYLAQHCLCLAKDGVEVNTMQYSTKLGVLAIGTKQGLAVVDVISNQLLHMLNSLVSILYLSDPAQYSKQMKKELPKKLVSRVSTKMLNLQTRIPSEATLSPPVTSSSSSPDLISSTLNTIQEQDCSVTVLRIVQMALDKNGTGASILWIGTTSGDVAAVVINVMPVSQEGSPRKVELLPTGTACTHNHGESIVNLLFLDKWGDLRLTPYNKGAQNRKEQEDLPTYYVVVTTKKLKSSAYGSSGVTTIQRVSTTATILKSDYFTCKDLPCLLSLMSDGKILVHSLPGLKPLMESTFAPLHDPRVSCTLHVSGDSLGIYMSSTTELERISIAAIDRLNFPNSLPDVFIQTPDPPPPGKGLMSYFTTPQEFDKEKLFGEGAGRPLPSLAKRNGQTGYNVAYHKHQRITPQSQATEPVHEAAAKADNALDQVQINRKLLEERKEKLSEVEEKAARLQDGAADFARLAERLSRKERGLF